MLPIPITNRLCALALALTLALAPTQGAAIAPVLLLLLKQVARSVAESTIKNAILSSLDGMGCKGIALGSALRAFDSRGGAAALMGGMPATPGFSAMASLSGKPGMPALPGLPALPGMPGSPIGQGGVAASVSPDMLAKMQRLMPGASELPPGAGLGPEQQAMFASLQQAMGQPLSPPETIATIDELADLGFLPKAVQGELKQCMLVLPASSAALGMAMGMLKPMVPQLREARAGLQALSPAELDEVAVALAAQIAPLPAAQRDEFSEFLGSGFFPPRIVTVARARLAAK